MPSNLGHGRSLFLPLLCTTTLPYYCAKPSQSLGPTPSSSSSYKGSHRFSSSSSFLFSFCQLMIQSPTFPSSSSSFSAFARGSLLPLRPAALCVQRKNAAKLAHPPAQPPNPGSTQLSHMQITLRDSPTLSFDELTI